MQKKALIFIIHVHVLYNRSQCQCIWEFWTLWLRQYLQNNAVHKFNLSCIKHKEGINFLCIIKKPCKNIHLFINLNNLMQRQQNSILFSVSFQSFAIAQKGIAKFYLLFLLVLSFLSFNYQLQVVCFYIKQTRYWL